MSKKKKENDYIDIRKIDIDDNKKKEYIKRNTVKIKSVKNEKTKKSNTKEKITNQVEIQEVTKKSGILIFIIIILTICLGTSIFYNISSSSNKVIIKYKLDENIVFYGDSLISEYEVDKYFKKNKVVNIGLNASKTNELLEGINDLYKYNPSKSIIYIGVTDLNYEIEEKITLDNIQKIIDSIRKNRKQSKIYIMSIIPINKKIIEEKELEFNQNLSNEDIIKINKKIKELCKKNNVKYIDIYNSLIDKDNKLDSKYTEEGLYLNKRGYKKISKKIQKYIKK